MHLNFGHDVRRVPAKFETVFLFDYLVVLLFRHAFHGKRVTANRNPGRLALLDSVCFERAVPVPPGTHSLGWNGEMHERSV